MKNWFITGVSRGIGKALAEAALARGDTVVGTVRESKPQIARGKGIFHCLKNDAVETPDGYYHVVPHRAGEHAAGSVG